MTILSISIPAALRTTLDAEARRQRRSRSFVVSEAVSTYIAQRGHDAFAAARDRTLREGLALSPAERVRLSEELWREFSRGRKPARAWTASFDTFADYERWRTGDAAPTT